MPWISARIQRVAGVPAAAYETRMKRLPRQMLSIGAFSLYERHITLPYHARNPTPLTEIYSVLTAAHADGIKCIHAMADICRACRAAVQAAMDAAAASGTAFAQKRGRKEVRSPEGDDTADAQKRLSGHSKKGLQDDSGDDDKEEEDDIPLKRPLVAPRPAARPHAQPNATETAQQASSSATRTRNQQGTAGGATQEEGAKSPQGVTVQEPVGASAAGQRPPVALPRRPPVARGGPSRALQAGGGSSAGGPG
jgi:hypothetical protein